MRSQTQINGLTDCLGIKKRLFIIVFSCLSIIAGTQKAYGQTSLNRVRVDGAELTYVDQGKGVPVVFVHGGLEDYRVWSPQMDAFSQRYRAIAYSRRHNYPNSAVTAGTNYSAVVDADDLAALIVKLKLAPAHVVGVSYGAYAAMFLAVRHPTLVRSLVLSEPPVLRWLPRLDGGKPLFTEIMSKVWEPSMRGFREGNEAGVRAAIDGFGELGYSGTDEKMTFATLPPELRSILVSNAAEWKALTMSKDAFPDVPFTSVRQIKAPTLLLSGQRSLTLHGLIDQQLERLLAHHERIVLANATHEMWNEYPEECRKVTLAFLNKH
jgi:pimeloyl-ACP methyl ester carboxylesterase